MKQIFLSLGLILMSTFAIGQWTQLNNVPFVDHHSNGFGIDGKAYIIKGSPDSNNGLEQNELWEYEPQSDSWNRLGFAPGPGRGFSIGDDMDGKYYFGFGSGRFDLWEFDPATNEFTELPECPCEGRAHPAFVAHNGKIFMGSGSGNTTDLKDWWIYDFATETWDRKEDIPGERRHHPYQFGIDDAIYVGGGHYENWLKWDITEERWSLIDDFPQGRVAGTQFSYDGRGFVLAGDDAEHEDLTENHFLMYDPQTNVWSPLPFEHSMGRWAPSSFILDNYLYYFGGLRGGQNESAMFRFDFNGINCIGPYNLSTENITDNSATLFWESEDDAVTDVLEWREVGVSNWIRIDNPAQGIILDDLTSCTEYEFRTNNNCGDDGNFFSTPFSFRTKGCGACLDLDYCDSSQSFFSFNTYINRVQFDDYENPSENNGGYAEFATIDEIKLPIGGFSGLYIEQGFVGFANAFNCQLFIDSNFDGVFSEDEKLVEVNETTESILLLLEIPEDLQPGNTRLRIVMSADPIDGPCDENEFADGEVEDYCIELVGMDTSIDDAEAITFEISPNPFNDQVNIQSVIPFAGNMLLTNLQGQIIYNQTVNGRSHRLDFSDTELQDGIYLLQMYSEQGQLMHVEKLVKN